MRSYRRTEKIAGTTVLLTAIIMLAALCLAPPLALAEKIKKGEKVAFNFVKVDLVTITKFVSDITGKNFIFDERLRGNITIIAPSKISLEGAFDLYTSVLKLRGFTLVPSGVDAYKIIPTVEARQHGMDVADFDASLLVNEKYAARVVTLKHIDAIDAIKFVQPFISSDGKMSAFGPGNVLLIMDSGLNIKKIVAIIRAIDRKPLSEEPEVVFLMHSSAEDLALILNEGIGKERTPGKPQVQKARAVAVKRLNALVLFGDASTREAMKRLVVVLDVQTNEEQGSVNVYFVEHADAEELAKVLEGHIQKVQRAGTQAAVAAKRQLKKPFSLGSSSISITPDKATNALVIAASPTDYKNILSVIKKLDRQRKQVFVEVMIVEAQIEKLKQLGAAWRMTVTKNDEPIAIGGFGTMDSSAVQSLISGLSGFTLGGVGNFLNVPITLSDGTQTTLSMPGFAALFNMNEFRDVVDVLSTPQLLTSDNEEAEIHVGENVPFISQKQTNPTASSASVFTTVQRKDVGITLRITPQINQGDYVKLDIYQEISAVKEPPASIAVDILTSVGPTTTKRSTKTSVVVKDRETVVISGLMQERGERVRNKIPVLGSIPIIGWLFKNRSVTRKKTNLLVFITPRIIKRFEDLAEITEEKQREFAMQDDFLAPGEAFIKFKQGVPRGKALEIILAQGGEVIKYMDTLKLYHIRLPKGQDLGEALNSFLSMPEVQYAEPNYKRKTEH